jgi:hypothetical protein
MSWDISKLHELEREFAVNVFEEALIKYKEKIYREKTAIPQKVPNV